MDQSDWQIVRSTPLFGTVSLEVAQSIIGHQPVTVHQKGDTLFHQGDPADSFFVLLGGWVKLYRVTHDGNEAVVGVFKPGETFAEAAMFLGGRYPVSAEVVTNARVLRVDGKMLRRRITEQPELALSMLASASYHRNTSLSTSSTSRCCPRRSAWRNSWCASPMFARAAQ